MEQLYKAKTTINFILLIKDNAIANNFCQKEYNIKHFRVLDIYEILGAGDKIHRELKSCWIKKLFELQELNTKLEQQ